MKALQENNRIYSSFSCSYSWISISAGGEWIRFPCYYYFMLFLCYYSMYVGHKIDKIRDWKLEFDLRTTSALSSGSSSAHLLRAEYFVDSQTVHPLSIVSAIFVQEPLFCTIPQYIRLVWVLSEKSCRTVMDSIPGVLPLFSLPGICKFVLRLLLN